MLFQQTFSVNLSSTPQFQLGKLNVNLSLNKDCVRLTIHKSSLQRIKSRCTSHPAIRKDCRINQTLTGVCIACVLIFANESTYEIPW